MEFDSSEMSRRSRLKKNFAWTDEAKAKARASHIGLKHSAETRAKIGRPGQKKPPGFAERQSARLKGKPMHPNFLAASRRALVKRYDTAPELAVRKILERRGEHFFAQFQIRGSSFAVFDFAIPSKRVLIEVDGCYWHGCKRCGHVAPPENAANDRRKDALAKAHGWRLVRVKECRVRV